MRNLRPAPRILAHVPRVLSVLAAVMLIAQSAWCQSADPASSPATPTSPFAGFFTLKSPGQLTLTLYGGGFRADEYATTQQGFQLEQSVTENIGIVARATGYQLYMGGGFDNPLAPGTGHQARLNFGRFQGGLDIALGPTTNFYLLAGGDVADSHAAVVEGDFTTWFMTESRFPINLVSSAVYDSQNGVTASEIDLRAIVYSTEQYVVLAGAGGAIFGGGFVPSIAGQAGPIVAMYLSGLQLGFNLQGGYGNAGGYAQLSLFKQFRWSE